MKYRFHYAELERKYGGQPDTVVDEWHEKATIETASKSILAGALRSLADELDPPEKTYR
jgi:hypothetical protein